MGQSGIMLFRQQLSTVGNLTKFYKSKDQELMSSMNKLRNKLANCDQKDEAKISELKTKLTETNEEFKTLINDKRNALEDEIRTENDLNDTPNLATTLKHNIDELNTDIEKSLNKKDKKLNRAIYSKTFNYLTKDTARVIKTLKKSAGQYGRVVLKSISSTTKAISEKESKRDQYQANLDQLNKYENQLEIAKNMDEGIKGLKSETTIKGHCPNV